MVTRLLKREGHTVAEAADGVAAVSMVSRTLIDRAQDLAARCAGPFMEASIYLSPGPICSPICAAMCAGPFMEASIFPL